MTVQTPPTSDGVLPEFLADTEDSLAARTLGYFIIRKVAAGDELLRAAGTVTKKLAGWLGKHDYLDAAAVADAAERGGDAARELPRAEELARLLFDHAAEVTVDMDRLGGDDIIEDYLTVEKVGSGVLWFGGGIGPVKVPATASKLAKSGWQINVTLAQAKAGWTLVEVGNLYP